MKTIFLLRHEECDSRGYTGAGSDVDLTAKGRTRAALKAGQFNRNGVNLIFTSPMRRCVDTAAPIAEAFGLKPIHAEELKEINFGLWEGRTYDEINDESPELLTDWLSAPAEHSPPEGETLRQLYERVENFWNKQVVLCHEPAILIISHGGPIRTLLSILSGGGIENHWAFHIDRGNFCRIQMFEDGKYQISGTNLKQITE
ncbi:MAG: histidine phosphatase family protein [Spirochaetales bacterium]|nr:histidine phosphatase family protein [Spirochaetales bacterium]